MDSLLIIELDDIDEIMERKEDIEEAEGGRFKITDLNSANWAFRKLAAIETKEKEITELANAERQRIKDWEEKEKKQLKDSKDFFNFLLEEYYRTQREVDPKFKLTTPYGKVSSRKMQPKFNYNDDLVIESLKKQGLNEFIKTKEEVNKADLKKEVTVIEYELGYVCVSSNEVLGEVRADDEEGINYVNVETGEVFDITKEEDIQLYKQVIMYDGKVVEGIEVEEQEDKVTIKVEV